MRITFSHPLHKARLGTIELVALAFPKLAANFIHNEIMDRGVPEMGSVNAWYNKEQDGQKARQHRRERQKLSVLSGLKIFRQYAENDWNSAVEMTGGLVHEGADPDTKTVIARKVMGIYKMAPDPKLTLSRTLDFVKTLRDLPVQAEVALEALSLHAQVVGDNQIAAVKVRDDIAVDTARLFAGQVTREYLFSDPLGGRLDVLVFAPNRGIVRDGATYSEDVADYTQRASVASGGRYQEQYRAFLDGVAQVRSEMKGTGMRGRPSFREALKAKAAQVSVPV